MNGIVLEPPELLYALNALRVNTVVGLDNERLFPADPAARRQALIQGLSRLQDHYWLRPAKKPGQYDLDNGLTLLAAIVADPEYTLLTVRQTSPQRAAVVNHYLSAGRIVELTETAEGNFRLALVPDLPATLGRIERVLELPATNGKAPVRLQIDAEAFNRVQELAAANQARAAELLTQTGVAGPIADELLRALRSSTGGTVLVGRPRGGQVAAARRARIFEASGTAWMAHRPAPESPVLSVETLAPKALAAVVERYIQTLATA